MAHCRARNRPSSFTAGLVWRKPHLTDKALVRLRARFTLAFTDWSPVVREVRESSPGTMAGLHTRYNGGFCRRTANPAGFTAPVPFPAITRPER